jgi:hypothetical protein
MKIVYTGPKKELTLDVCHHDLFTLEEFEDDAIVVVMRHLNHTFCYNLHELATWFLRRAIEEDDFPTLPETRRRVPASMYRCIIRHAHAFLPQFRDLLMEETRGLTRPQKMFVLKGRRRAMPRSSEMRIDLSDLLAYATMSDDDITVETLIAELETGEGDAVDRVLEDLERGDEELEDLVNTVVQNAT